MLLNFTEKYGFESEYRIFLYLLLIGNVAKEIIMNRKDMVGKVHNAVYQQCQRRGYATPVDVLMDIGVLDKKSMKIGVEVEFLF